MDKFSAMHFSLALSLLALFSWPTVVLSASDIYYCASVNTGASNAANSSTFQSNGLCIDHCTGKWAFGILQGKQCWCSNIAPNKATTVDDKKCDTGCPGYPDDSCGDASKGLFAYLEMSGQMPTGTATAPKTATSTTEKETSTKSDSSTTTTSGTSTTTTGHHTVAVETNAGGEIKTITVGGSGPTSTPTPTSSDDDDDGSGLAGGTIAGVVVGSVGGCAAIVALIFMVLLAKRRSRSPSPDPSVQNILLDGRASKGSQMSFMKGMFSDNHSHTLSAGSSIAPRMPPAAYTDNRMKDASIWPTGRRNSSVSLADDQDYSRPVLRLTNPD
ncbi:Cell wall integrity and stress response component 4 [Aspergillus melleus]|uniref:Cell wall integrity and stress response component 4 n=1 Tax=Aspergillus melleus TaxID=138277 RepID=A0ACC3AR97_9EURO|nr:Cell wall integrity and stress response component 4 [Aspergillus melleus]